MRTQNLVVTAMLLGGAAACTGGQSTTTTGTRFDGVKVQCTQSGDDVAMCAPVTPGDACDAANVLWPPNHKMIQFTLADCAPPPGCGSGSGSGSGSGGGGIGIIMRTTSDAAPTPTAKITSITADEAVDVGAGGDGHTTTADIKIDDATTFELRSERQGGGDGRVYRVNWADAAGVTGSCEFDVPHDQGPAHGAVDSGVVVTVTP
jgi:hypothetical protein